MNTANPILAERLQMTFRQLPAALRVGTVLAIASCFIFAGFVETWIIALWFILHSLITLLRYFSLRGLISDQFRPEQVYSYSTRYTLTALLLGLSWSAIAFITPYVSADYRIIIFVLLIGISGGALTANVGHLPSFLAYILPIFSVFAIQLFLLKEREWFAMGALTVVYTTYISISARKLQATLISSIKLRFESESNARELEDARNVLSIELEKRKHTEQRLKDVMQELEQMNKHLEELAAIDELTGLANRRSFDTAIAREWNRARREKSNIALLMIDIDFFKSFNDHYHHLEGDKALTQVAKVLQQFARRPGDIAARYGGEEFALILSNSDSDYVAQIAEDIRYQIEQLDIKHEGQQEYPGLTVSIGSSLVNAPHNDDYSSIIRQADAALYRAKQEGRNRVIAA